MRVRTKKKLIAWSMVALAFLLASVCSRGTPGALQAVVVLYCVGVGYFFGRDLLS
jgi:hypothetical protein